MKINFLLCRRIEIPSILVNKGIKFVAKLKFLFQRELSRSFKMETQKDYYLCANSVIYFKEALSLAINYLKMYIYSNAYIYIKSTRVLIIW